MKRESAMKTGMLKSLLKIVLLMLSIYILTGCMKQSPVFDISMYDFRAGDILLQHRQERLGSFISDISDTPYSYCGIVVYKEGKPYVMDAIGEVRLRPLKMWIEEGYLGMFTQLRVQDLSESELGKVIESAYKYFGKPEDLKYEMENNKLYSAEFIFKAFLRGAKIKISDNKSLGEYDYRKQEEYLRYIIGYLPIDRVLLTPASFTQRPETAIVHSTFPTRRSPDIDFDTNILSGQWQGEFTMPDNKIAIIQLWFKPNGGFLRGVLNLPSGEKVNLLIFEVSPFTNMQTFAASYADTRGNNSEILAKIWDRGYRITGVWHDEENNTGIFSIKRIK